jgi:hypothetical protein
LKITFRNIVAFPAGTEGHHEKPPRKMISRLRFEPGTFPIQSTGRDLGFQTSPQKNQGASSEVSMRTRKQKLYVCDTPINAPPDCYVEKHHCVETTCEDP